MVMKFYGIGLVLLFFFIMDIFLYTLVMAQIILSRIMFFLICSDISSAEFLSSFHFAIGKIIVTN